MTRLFVFRWKPGKDLVAVAVSWLLVVGSLYRATAILGQAVWSGVAYFLPYVLLGATLFGVGLPLYWTVVVRRRPLADLGITARWLVPSLLLQLVLGAFQYMFKLASAQFPSFDTFLSLAALALTAGFFEAVFWRGWVLLRLEDAFGIMPAILLGSALYAASHIGYAIPASQMIFLFLTGILYAVVFRLTKSIWILWPVFQPMGQLVTMIQDGLSLSLLDALGFAEVLLVMFVLVWLAARYYRKSVLIKMETDEH